MEEIGAVHDFMRGLNRDVKVIWGYAYDESLGDSVKITLLASGFEVKNFTGEAVDKIVNEEEEAKRQAEDEEIGRSSGRDARHPPGRHATVRSLPTVGRHHGILRENLYLRIKTK